MTVIDDLSKAELAAYTEFAKRIVVKQQELADAYESEALTRAGGNYKPNIQIARRWEEVQAYSVLGSASKPERKFNPKWYYRDEHSVEQEIAVDSADNTIWLKQGANWLNITTGAIRLNVSTTWTILTAPGGVSYVDVFKPRILIPTQIWYDSVSDEYSALGPASGMFIPTGDAQEVVYPDGLSAVIPTPQEYVSAKLEYSAGGMLPARETELRKAIESFEALGLWEDVRQPFFATNSNGAPLTDGNGVPIRNSRRVVQLRYRGELNDYYRRLVADHNISPLEARTAEQFEVIGWRDIIVDGLSAEQMYRYVNNHATSVRVFKKTMFNEAFRGDILYYNYCRMYIAWMAIMESINQKMENFQDIDRMSTYELSNLIYSHGIYQFDDIPLVYKRRFAKSLEKMLGNKGTTEVFRDILGVFGLNRDVTIWKYYLARYFPLNISAFEFRRAPTASEYMELELSSGDSVRGNSMVELMTNLEAVPGIRSVRNTGLSFTYRNDYTENNETPIRVTSLMIRAKTGDAIIEFGDIVPSDEVDFTRPEVGFVKADIDDPSAEMKVATSDNTEIEDYDVVTGADPLWETTREEARKQAFSVLQTKYFSISSALDTVYNGMAMAILWGMLKDAELRGRSGTITVPNASDTIQGVASMTLFEGFVAALILNLWRFDVEDIIPHGESGVATIISARTDGLAYPNESSLLPFSTVIDRVAAEPDPLRAERMGQMTDNNVDIMGRIDQAANEMIRNGLPGSYHPIYGGEEARLVGQVSEINNLWDHKFIARYQTDAFGLVNTYSEWLRAANPALMDWVEKSDEGDSNLDALITLVSLLEDSVQSQRLQLMAILGVDDVLMMYIERMIKFFKAYTTDMRNYVMYMLIDRPASESLRLMNLLAGLISKLDFTDGLDKLKDQFTALIVKIYGDDPLAIKDLQAFMASLSEQDIVRIREDLEGIKQTYERVNPAAVMQDTFSITTKMSRKDTLTVITKKQLPGDVVSADKANREPAITEYNANRKWRTSPRQGFEDGSIILK